MSAPTVVFHIVRRADWTAARRAGVYRPASLAGAGFIHFSTADQVARVANAAFRGERDLVLLKVPVARLGAELRWEAAAGEDVRFPHLYAPLDANAVEAVLPFAEGPDGFGGPPPA